MKTNNIKLEKNLSFQKNNSKKLYLKTEKDSFEKSNNTTKCKKNYKLPKKIALFLAAILAGGNLAGCAPKTEIKNNAENTATQHTITSEDFNNLSQDGFSEEYFMQYNKNPNISQELLEDIQEDIQKNNDFCGKSTILLGRDISDDLKNTVENCSSGINGYIDYPIAQGITGDCWLIAGIENLSRTKTGAEYLYNSLSINDEGNFEVYFKGPDLTYTITPQEINDANTKYSLLSFGDDDMLIFELAVDKFRKDVYENKINIDNTLPDYFYYTDLVGYNHLTSGEIRQAYWLFAGIKDSLVAHQNKNEIDNLFEKFENNKENSLLSVSFTENAKVEDINENILTLLNSHEYGIKDIKDGYITLINPYQNFVEISIPVNDFYELPICDLIYCEIE